MTGSLRRLVKKKRIFYSQADSKRCPPPLYGQLFVIFLGVFLTSQYDYMCYETEKDSKKKSFFIQLQEPPIVPLCLLLLCKKRSDSSIAEALRAWKRHFWDPSQWDQMCFEYQRIKWFHTSLQPGPYLIFVIFLHRQKFWTENFTPKNALITANGFRDIIA